MLQELPELILDLICDYLSYDDVLVLRSTCKTVKRFVDVKEFTTVNLFVEKFPYYHRLFYTGHPVGYPYSYQSNKLTILTSNRFREQFCNVQKMAICTEMSILDFKDSTEFDLNSLNYFTALRHLEINKFPCIKGKLNLQKLQISAFLINDSLNNVRVSSFELDCPRLIALRIYRCKAVLTSATDQLDYLHYHHKYAPNDYLKSISHNLRNLSTICFENINFLLKFLSDLKMRSLSVPSLGQLRLEQCGDLEGLDKLARSLEDLKGVPDTRCIKFTFNGRPINSPDELLRIISLKRANEAENLESYLLSLRSGYMADFNLDFHMLSAEKLNYLMKGNLLNIMELNDRLLLFLNKQPELQFLLTSTRSVRLLEDLDIELSEEIIKKLKNVERIEFYRLFQSSDLTTKLLVKNCKSLRFLTMYRQTLTERLLEMMSEHLNLQHLRINICNYESLKPLAKFRNLEGLSLDFDPQKDELAFVYENNRTLRLISILCQPKEWIIKLQRTRRGPKMHKIMVKMSSESDQIFEFDTPHAMIGYYYEKGLFKKRGNHETSTRLDPLG